MAKWNPFNGWRNPEVRLQKMTAEYNRLCLQVGHLEHTKHAIERQLRLLHQQMEGIGQEAQRLSQKKKAEPPKDPKDQNAEPKAA